MDLEDEETEGTPGMVGGRNTERVRDLKTAFSILPGTFRERVAFLITLCGIPIGVLLETIFVFPQYYQYFSADGLFHFAATAFLVQNVYLNLWKILRTDASGKSSKLPHILQPNWRYCYVCKLNSPPRAYHCHICHECILKRDHHSLFVGRCIGYHNHRFYFVMVVNLWLLAVYAMWFHGSHAWGVITADYGAGYGVWFLVMPQFAFLCGFLSLVQFWTSSCLTSSVLALAGTTFLIAFQLYTIIRGQTREEYWANIRAYDRGVWGNFKDVLGERPILAMFCANFPSPLSGDGLKFSLKSIREEIKNI